MLLEPFQFKGPAQSERQLACRAAAFSY